MKRQDPEKTRTEPRTAKRESPEEGHHAKEYARGDRFARHLHSRHICHFVPTIGQRHRRHRR